MLLLLSFSTLIVAYECKRGYIDDVIFKKKYLCPNVMMASYAKQSRIQCVSKCLREEKCTLINYSEDQEYDKTARSSANCEVFIANENFF